MKRFFRWARIILIILVLANIDYRAWHQMNHWDFSIISMIFLSFIVDLAKLKTDDEIRDLESSNAK